MDINLSEIAALVNAGKGANYFEDRLERSFVPMFDKLESISRDKTPLNVTDILSTNSKRFDAMKKRYEKAVLAFIEGFEEKVSGISGGVTQGSQDRNKNFKSRTTPVILQHIHPKVLEKLKGITMAISSKDKSNFKTEDEIHDAMPVHIQSIDDGIYERMGEISASIQEANKPSEDKEKDPKGKSGSLLKWLAKAGIAVGALALGAALLFEGFMTDGRLKGTLKLIGGSLVKMGARIIDSLVKLFIKPMFTKAGEGIKGVMSFIVKKMPKTGLFKLVATAFKLGGLKSLSKLAGKGASIVFKSIYGLGAIISFGFAYSRFKAGDTVGGMLEIAAGLTGLIPVVGSAVSLGINLFLAARDLTTTRNQRQSSSSVMFTGIKEWFMKNKFFRSVTNFFKGIFGLFTAKSGSDVDDAIDLIKDGALFALIPAAYPIMGLFEFFRNGSAEEFIVKTGEMFSNFGSWIGEIFSNFWANIATYLGNMFSHIEDSHFFQTLKINFKMVIANAKLGIANVFNKLIEMINIIPKAMNGVVNYSIDKWNAIVEDSDLIWDGFKVGRFSFGESGIDTYNTSNIQSELDKLVDEKKQLQEKRDREISDKKEAEERKRFEEQRNMHMSNTSSIINAINGQTGVLAATIGASNAPDRKPPIIINNSESNDSTRRVRQASYIDNYIPVPSY